MDAYVDALYQDPLWLEWLDARFGTSDRTEISRLAFANPAILAQLNAQSALKIGVHLGFALSRRTLTFVEFPLLFESGLQDQFDCTILITANTDVRIERVVARGRKTHAQAAEVIASQMPEAQKAALSDFVVDTTESDKQNAHGQALVDFVASKIRTGETYE